MISIIQPGDCVGMIGDSITYDARWWSAVRCGLLTEFPGSNLDFRNLAIAGDSACETLERYEWDIAPVPITSAIVMLGMNDVWREGYADPNPGMEIVAKRRHAINTYAESIARILGFLKERNIRTALLSSTPYEQEAELSEANLCGVDEALQECARLARSTAAKYGAQFIDVHSPLLKINRLLRRGSSSATLIGPDRVHPSDLCHAVMGRVVLGALCPTAQVLPVEINVFTRVVEGDGVSLGQSSPDCVSWIYTGVLPNTAVPERADELLGSRPRRLIWRVKTTPGRWTLWINGEPIHTAGAIDWSDGIDVGRLNSPIRQRAEQIQRAGEKLNDEEKRYRCLLMLRIWSQRSGGTGHGDDFIAYLDKLASEQPPIHWLRDATTDAKRLLANQAAHEEAVSALRHKLAEAAQPWQFQCELRPA